MMDKYPTREQARAMRSCSAKYDDCNSCPAYNAETKFPCAGNPNEQCSNKDNNEFFGQYMLAMHVKMAIQEHEIQDRTDIIIELIDLIEGSLLWRRISDDDTSSTVECYDCGNRWYRDLGDRSHKIDCSTKGFLLMAKRMTI